MEYVCEGSRDSKWFWNGVHYVRIYQRRKGDVREVYSPERLGTFPDVKYQDGGKLATHRKKLLDAMDVVI